MKRRQILTAPAALAATAAAPAFAAVLPQTDAPSKILDLYSRWCAASAKGAYLGSLRGYDDHETPEEREAEDLSEALRVELIDCQPETMPEIAAMLHILWDSLHYVPCDMESLCDGGAPQVLAAIWRAASGREGVPGSA